MRRHFRRFGVGPVGDNDARGAVFFQYGNHATHRAARAEQQDGFTRQFHAQPL